MGSAIRSRSQTAIADAYNSIGDELGAIVVPIGLAWQRFLSKYDKPCCTIATKPSHTSRIVSGPAVFLFALLKAKPLGVESGPAGSQADKLRCKASLGAVRSADLKASKSMRQLWLVHQGAQFGYGGRNGESCRLLQMPHPSLKTNPFSFAQQVATHLADSLALSLCTCLACFRWSIVLQSVGARRSVQPIHFSSTRFPQHFSASNFPLRTAPYNLTYTPSIDGERRMLRQLQNRADDLSNR